MKSRYMLRISLIMLFLIAITAPIYAQYREEKPYTLNELLERICGEQVDAEGPVIIKGTESYLPRQFYHTRTSKKSRRAILFLDAEGKPVNMDYHTLDAAGDVVISPDSIGNLIVNVDQYRLMFEFSIPQQITVVEPDGETKAYWYMTYKLVNIDEAAVFGTIDFNMQTSPEDLQSSPNQIPSEKWTELLNRYLGSKEIRDLMGYTKDEEEYLRSFKREKLLNYLNYPDRFLMDLICEKESYWYWDKFGRRFNPFVPTNLLNWRTKLRVIDDYKYPAVTIYDKIENDGEIWYDCYVIMPKYTDGHSGKFNEDNFTSIEVKYISGDGNVDAEPVVTKFDTLAEFKASELGAKTMRVPAYSRSMPELHFKMTLFRAFEQNRPKYMKGDVVDQYGHIMPAGHPDYQNGILLNSDFTVWKYMHGAHLLPIDEVVKEKETPAMNMESLGEIGVVLAPDAEKYTLPETANGDKLIATSVIYLGGIIQHYSNIINTSNLRDKLLSAIPAEFERITSLHKQILSPNSKSFNSEENINAMRTFLTELTNLFPRLPEFLQWTIKDLLIDPSRIYFSEAIGQNAPLIGIRTSGYVWQAMYHPATCWVKTATPRRYAANDKVLKNYRLPLKPVWDPKKYIEINQNDVPKDHKLFINGRILDYEEYTDDDSPTGYKRKDHNFYGADGRINAYGDSIVDVDAGMEPYFDGTWGRDPEGVGRPVKLVNFWGKSIHNDYRVYKPGDRVTPMEWEAFASRLNIKLVHRLMVDGRINVDRKFLKPNDFLVGLPRLTLSEYAYYLVPDADGNNEIKPRGRFIEGSQKVEEVAGRFWRWGFSCDASGDYDTLIYEELDADGKVRFNDMLKSTLAGVSDEEKVTQSVLKLVPEMDNLGISMDYIEVSRKQRIPQRVNIFPKTANEPEKFKRLFGNDFLNGPVIWVKAYQPVPNYTYAHEYMRYSEEDVNANAYAKSNAEVDFKAFVQDYVDAYWEAYEKGENNPSELPTIADMKYKTSEDEVVTEHSDKMIGLYKIYDKPTVNAAKVDVYYKAAENTDTGEMEYPEVILDRTNIEYISRKLKDENFAEEEEVDKFVLQTRNWDKIVLKRHPIGKEENAILWGEIIREDYRTVKIRVHKELLPGVVHGVAIFENIDRDWDFMNVFVSGLKGPLRRRGFDSVDYNVLGVKPGTEKTKKQYLPHILHEEWVMMLRFTRPGDQFFTENDRMHFERRFWYRAKVGEDNVKEKFLLSGTSLGMELYED
ncbi:MAG: hypothetical protein K8S87_04370 [Planctomycetes bacterium]|nr:hypothetical protein [Planctomycetota bacterium]